MPRDYSPFGGRRVNTADSGVPSRLLCAVRAPTKAGTTRFALTAPKENGILFCNFDRPLRDNVPDLAKLVGKAELIEMDCTNWLRGGAEDVQARAKKVVMNVKNAAHQAIKDGVSTVVIDKATDLHDALPWAAFGAAEKVMRSGAKMWKDKTPQNTYWKNFLQPFKASNCKTNLVLVHRTKDEYVDDKPSGETVPRGYEDIAYECTVNVELLKDRTIEGPKKFKLVVTDCTFNTTIEGDELSGKMVNFCDLAMLIAPESEPEDWA